MGEQAHLTARSAPRSVRIAALTISFSILLQDVALLYPAHLGAIIQVWSGTTEEGRTHGGKVSSPSALLSLLWSELTLSPISFSFSPPSQFLVPWARVGRAVPAAHDEALAKKLWDFMEHLCEGY